MVGKQFLKFNFRIAKELNNMPKILFIDDEPEFVRPQINVLEELDYVVTLRSNPDAALEALQNDSFDLIILDIIMPPHDNGDDENGDNDFDDNGSVEIGEVVYNEIRDELGINTPIIFMTVVRDQDIRNRLSNNERKRGLEPRFLTKPVSSMAVVDEVQKVLGVQ